MKISMSAKMGYIRCSDLLASEKRRLNRFNRRKVCTITDIEAIKNDWMEVGNEIRNAEREYRNSIGQ